MTWPVIQPASGETRTLASPAMSSGIPRRCRACIAAMTDARVPLLVIAAERGVRVREGATTLIRMCGLSSAARERASPSTAPLAMATEAWPVKPCATATIENRTTPAPAPALRAGAAAWMARKAPGALIRKSASASPAVSFARGRRLMVPTA